jgi:hypothetical protein
MRTMPEAPYHVLWLPDARIVLRKLARKAQELGLLEKFKQTIVELDERLGREPLEVGELIRAKGSIVIHAAGTDMVGVNFGLDTERKIVVVQRCWALRRGWSR